jgi:hypothetical protein
MFRFPMFLVAAGALAVVFAATGPPAAQAAQALPIALTGWNADVVTDANPMTRFAQRFDGGTGSWFQAGTDGNPDGLPSGMDFTSARVNPVTGTNAVFHLLPANGPNVLRLGDTDPPTNTLALVNPAPYSSLAVLAASGSAFAATVGTLTVNFADGTSSGPLVYNAFDWNASTAGVTPFVALGDVGRNLDIGPTGTSFTYFRSTPLGYALYETDIDLAALGLDNRPIQSITFNRADPAFSTGVFAVSGVGVPEPSALTLLGLGVIGLLGYSWRRQRAA